MRTIVLFIVTMLTGVVCTGLEAAKAAPLPGVAAADAQLKSTIEEVGWRRRYYWRYAYPVPYTYYPPVYSYYPPPAYYAPVYPSYPYYRPYGYYITHPIEARPSWPSFFVRGG
jgi:hypothetical protein